MQKILRVRSVFEEESTLIRVLTKIVDVQPTVISSRHAHAGVKECHWVWGNLRARLLRAREAGGSGLLLDPRINGAVSP